MLTSLASMPCGDSRRPVLDGASAAANRGAERFSIGTAPGEDGAFTAADANSIRDPSSGFRVRPDHLTDERRRARRLEAKTLDFAAIGCFKRAPIDQTTRALLDLREKRLQLPMDLDREAAGGGKRLDAPHVLRENLQFNFLIGDYLGHIRVALFDQGVQTLSLHGGVHELVPQIRDDALMLLQQR